MGLLYFNSLIQADWPVGMAYIVIVAALIVFSNLLADVLYTVVDPRIRYA
jgi:peptide/nickel transport system permease protein